MNKLNELKKIIQKANPEIMKLEMGCQLFIQNYCVSLTLLQDRSSWCDVDGQIGNTPYVGWTGNGIQHFGDKHIQEILGRPINLQDVLIAIDKPYTCYKHIEFDNMLLIVCDDIRIKWNLKETLDNQSQESINYLHSILCKKS